MKHITLIALAVLTALTSCSGGDDNDSTSSSSEQEVTCLQNSGACLQMPLSSCVQLASIGVAQIVQGCNSAPLSSSSNVISSSSSSIGSSSSSSSSIGYSYSYGSVTYEGQTYKTVKIGEQTWMAENLNYHIEGSSVCNNNDPAKCTIYGRLYSWVTAMALGASCNNENCSDQIQSKHRGICPTGWHIPTDDEWEMLSDFAGGSFIAGKHLRSVSEGGDDIYGFAALMGGLGNSTGFSAVGYTGSWWANSEFTGYGGTKYDLSAGYWVVQRYLTNLIWSSSPKSTLLSVRCIMN